MWEPNTEATRQRDHQSEDSFRQWVGHSLWKATDIHYGRLRTGSPDRSEKNRRSIIVDIVAGTRARVKEATANFYVKELWGIDVHAYD